MGKTIDEIRKPECAQGERMPREPSPEILADVVKDWEPNAKALTSADVVTDGFVIVIVVSGYLRSTYVCQDVVYKNNSYIKLGVLLRYLGVLKMREQLRDIRVYRQCAWHKVDLDQDTFDSGETIMFRMKSRPRIKRVIRKAPKKLPSNTPSN